MKDPQSLFNASPEAFFEELGAQFRSLDARLERMAARLDSLADVMESHLSSSIPVSRAGGQRSHWSYDVRLPNIYFGNVFDLETGPNYVKRWVNGSGKLAGTLALSRDVPLAFEILICDFATARAGLSFALTVDGRVLRWAEPGPRLFRAIVPPDPSVRGLAFSVDVDPAHCGGKDVSFSFSSITVHPLQVGAGPDAA